MQQYNLTTFAPQQNKDEVVSEVSQTDFVRLGMKFGSKRKQRSLEQYAKMRTDTEVLQEKLKKMSDTVTVDASVMEKQDDASSEYLPPANRDADAVEDVYKLTDLLSSNEIEILKGEAMKILKNVDKYKKEE